MLCLMGSQQNQQATVVPETNTKTFSYKCCREKETDVQTALKRNDWCHFRSLINRLYGFHNVSQTGQESGPDSVWQSQNFTLMHEIKKGRNLKLLWGGFGAELILFSLQREIWDLTWDCLGEDMWTKTFNFCHLSTTHTAHRNQSKEKTGQR